MSKTLPIPPSWTLDLTITFKDGQSISRQVETYGETMDEALDNAEVEGLDDLSTLGDGYEEADIIAASFSLRRV